MFKRYAVVFTLAVMLCSGFGEAALILVAANQNISVDGCAAGDSSPDTIIIPVNGTLTLGSNRFIVTEQVTIGGPGAVNYKTVVMPVPGSAVIDSGDPAGCLGADGSPLVVDQRDLPRPADGDNDCRRITTGSSSTASRRAPSTPGRVRRRFSPLPLKESAVWNAGKGGMALA